MKTSERSLINWTYSLWREKPENFKHTQCFFGEHLLLQYPEAHIMLVESEKTAIIGFMYFPDFLWLASGGNNGCLNLEASKVLSGRKVILVPDLKMEKNWNGKAEMLSKVGVDVSIFDMGQLNPSELDRKAGLDIADFILRVKP